MRVGELVTIFRDPITEKDSEGIARLLSFVREEGPTEYWNVEFLSDRRVVRRFIKKKESPKMINPDVTIKEDGIYFGDTKVHRSEGYTYETLPSKYCVRYFDGEYWSLACTLDVSFSTGLFWFCGCDIVPFNVNQPDKIKHLPNCYFDMWARLKRVLVELNNDLRGKEWRVYIDNV